MQSAGGSFRNASEGTCAFVTERLEQPTIENEDVLFKNYGTHRLSMVRGDGVWLYDDKGSRYLDFTAGIAVCSLGHAHPAVTEAIVRQAQTLIHCSNLYGVPAQLRVAKKLTEESGLGRVLFCNSGAEANEGALKLARRYGTRIRADKTKLISLPGAFHGRTFGALSVTPKPAYQAGFLPLLPDCASPPSLADVLQEIDARTAACIVEVIQGEGGVHPIPVSFLRDLQAKLREHQALLIVDEVQTGIGRTGEMFAFLQASLQPDILTLAKGLGNGVPVGAIVARQEVADVFDAGSHGTTFGGNPLAMAVVEAVLEVVSEPAFLKHVRELGEVLRAALEERFTNVTGRGLMWGFDVPIDAKEFVRLAEENGCLLTAVGPTRVRAVPPLILDKQHVDEFARCMDSILALPQVTVPARRQ